VLYLRSHIIEKPEQLAKRCLVEKAASRFWCAVHGDRAGDLERKKRAGSLEAPIEKIFGERADLLHRHRAAHESGHAPDRLPPRWRDRLVDIAGQDETSIPEEVLSVGPPPDERAKALGFSEWNALPAFQRFVVAPNLRINRVAKAESLVPELGNIFSFGRVARRIDSTNCFQKTERYPRVDRRRHIQEKGESASDGRRGAKKHNSLVKDLRLLTRGGVVAAAILGAVSLLAGPGWAILLIAFFISGTFLSHVGEARKLARTGGITGKHGPRDVRQVLANGGVFGLAALGSLIAPSAAWMVFAAGAIATSAADTWATEVGTLSSARARSILTWQDVPAGTSGAISLPGTLAALAGAGFIAVLALLSGWPGESVCAALIAGFAGSMLDSILGSGVQGKRWCDQCGRETERLVHDCGSATGMKRGLAWIDNDAVNAISSLGGAAMAALCLL